MTISLDRARIIGIVSGKGGVGKTTITANLGIALVKEFRKRVLVVDGNVTSANLGLHLGVPYPPTTIHDVLDDKVAPAQSVYIQESGLHIIPASLSIKRKAYYEKLRDKLYQLVDNYDIIIIDGAAGVGAEVKATIHACDELLVVTTPEVPAVTGALKVIETAKEMGVPVRGIILNDFKRQKFETSAHEIETTCGVPVLAIIPDEISIPASIAHRVALVQYRPQSESAEVFFKLAGVLIGEKFSPKVSPFQRFQMKLLTLIGIRDPPITQPEVKMDENFRFLKRQTAGERESMIEEEAKKEAALEDDISSRSRNLSPNESDSTPRELPNLRKEDNVEKQVPIEKIRELEGDMASLRRIKDLLEKGDTDISSLEEELSKVRKILLILEREKRQGLISDESYSELKAGNERKLQQLEEKMSKFKAENG